MDDFAALLNGAAGNTTVLVAFLIYLVKVLIPKLEERNETTRKEFLSALDKQEQNHLAAMQTVASKFEDALAGVRDGRSRAA